MTDLYHYALESGGLEWNLSKIIQPSLAGDCRHSAPIGTHIVSFTHNVRFSVKGLTFHTHCWRKLTLPYLVIVQHSPSSPNYPNIDQTCQNCLKRPTNTVTSCAAFRDYRFYIPRNVADYQLQSVVVWDLTGYTLLEKVDSLSTLLLRKLSNCPSTNERPRNWSHTLL